jgi:very-short-patch-repair endonuclease
MRIVEVDGLGVHSTADQLHNDLVRQNALMAMGWEVRRFSARAVRRDPQGVIAEIVAFING